MGTTVSVGGNNYVVPAYNDTGWAQGSTSLPNLLIAICNNMGGGAVQYVNATTSPISPVNNKTYLVASNSLAVTFNLPSPAGNYWIGVRDSGNNCATNNITLHRAGSELINGTAADLVLKQNGQYWVLMSDGTNWFTLAAPPSTILAADGTTLLPSVAFASAPGTGMSRSAGGSLVFSRLGVNQLDLDGTNMNVNGINIIPSADNSKTCGAVGARWSDVRSVKINGADYGFMNGYILREYPATADDVQNHDEAWFKANANIGIQVINDVGETVCVIGRDGTLYAKSFQPLSLLEVQK